jgi:hypothetical protein
VHGDTDALVGETAEVGAPSPDFRLTAVVTTTRLI